MTTEPDHRIHPPAEMPKRAADFRDACVAKGWTTDTARETGDSGVVTVTITAIHPDGSPTLSLVCVGGEYPHRGKGMDWRDRSMTIHFGSSSRGHRLRGIRSLREALDFHSKATRKPQR